jgi:hypothetical protein
MLGLVLLSANAKEETLLDFLKATIMQLLEIVEMLAGKLPAYYPYILQTNPILVSQY